MVLDLKHLKSTKLLLFSTLGASMVIVAYLVFTLNPLELITDAVLSLSSMSIFYNLWLSPPIDVLVKIYIFNVTNPEEFLRGEEKLRVEEIGPYVYRELLENTEPIFNDNGTLTFAPRRRVEFVREHSVGDVQTDTLLSPNIPLLGISAALVNSSMFVNLGVASISSYLGSKSFVNLTIDEYLWGYDDPLVDLANKVVPSWINFPRFGILDRLFALDDGDNIVTILLNPDENESQNPLLTRAEKRQKHSIQRWNGSPGLPVWGWKDTNETEPFHEGNSRCNLVEGSLDGILYPQKLQPNSSFRLYRRAFCRTMPIYHMDNAYTKDGYEGFVFALDPDFLETPDVNPENTCYCLRPGNCLPKGLSDLTPCYYGIPVTLSQPHFLNGDPSLLTQIDGLSPNPEKHDTKLIVHPRMGIPLDGNLRMQINLKLPQTRYNSKTKPFNNLVLPLFHADLFINGIPTSIHILLTLLFHIAPVAQQVLVIFMALIGTGLVAGSALMLVIPSKNTSDPLLRGDYSALRVIPLKSADLCKPEIKIYN